MSIFVNLLAQLPFMDENRANIIMTSFAPMLQGAIQYTIPLTLIAFVCGISIALAVALIRIFPRKNIIHHILYRIALAYVAIIRGTPLLVQLFIIFYGLPSIGVTLEPFISAIIGFSLNVGAYASESIRASILSISKGQWDAGMSVGMSYMQTFRYIILPQAIRVAVPPLSNTFISLVKDTSLASLVLVTELFKQAQIIAARNYEFMLVYIQAAIIYWVICFGLTLLQGRLEKWTGRYIRR